MIEEDSEDSVESKTSIVVSEDTLTRHCKRIDYSAGDQLCRVCLRPGTIPIFGDEDISGDLMLFAGIEVNKDDCLPQHICTECQELLLSAITLRRIANYSDNILKEKVKSLALEYSEDDLDESIREDDEVSFVEIDNETVRSEGIDDKESSNDADSVQSNKGLSEKELIIMANELRNAKEWQCEICDEGFRTLEMIEEHSKFHNAEDIVACEVCRHIVSKDMYHTHLDIHKAIYKQRVKNKFRKVECNVCSKQVSQTYLKKHMTMHGPDEIKAERSKQCTICGKFISCNYYNAHMKLHLPTAKKEEVLKKKCHICSLMIQEQKYKEHISSHAARIRRYVCEECGKEFHYSSAFRTHLLTHKDVFNFKCGFCLYRAKHLGLLKMHVRTHTKDYSYKCTVCEKSFISKSNLSAHERIHSEPQFMCPDCGKMFRHQRALKFHHNNVHNKVRNFHCNMCSKSFVRNDLLLAHKRRVHNLKFEGPIGRKPSYLLVAQNSNNHDGSSVQSEVRNN